MYEQRKRNRPKDASTATGETAADATKQMLEKKKFSKKINYDAIKSLFDKNGSEAGSTYAGSDDDDGSDGDNMLIGQSYGSKKRKKKGISKRGTPINIPAPTFGARASSRAPSENPASSVVGSPRGGEREIEDEPEAVDADNAWRSQYQAAGGDDWADGYDEL